MLIIPGTEADEARLAAICVKYGIAELKVFGSRARGQAAPDGDIGILYTLRPGRRLGWEIEQLADELTELFGHTVDLVSLHALHPLLHGYWSIDLAVLHTTATDQLPGFASSLRRALTTSIREPEPSSSMGRWPGTSPVTLSSIITCDPADCASQRVNELQTVMIARPRLPADSARAAAVSDVRAAARRPSGSERYDLALLPAGEMVLFGVVSLVSHRPVDVLLIGHGYCSLLALWLPG